MWKKLAAWAFGIVAVTGWLSLLAPPLRFLQTSTVGGLFVELVKASNSVYPSDEFYGWAFLALTIVSICVLVAALRTAVRYVDESFSSITVLDAYLRLEIPDDDMARARLSRVQSFHANRSGISAYKYVSTLDTPAGHIDLDSVRISSSLGLHPISNPTPMVWGTSKRVEVIETFVRCLPTNLFASLLPSWMTRALWRAGLFQNLVVRRAGDVEYLNEHNGPQASMAVKANHLTADLKIEISFPERTAPADKHINCMLVRENVVERMGYTRSHKNGRVTIAAGARNFRNEELRIQWRNRRLEKYLKRSKR